jgi:phage tail-like protein
VDANQTRFQLVFGEADWFGNGASGSPPTAPIEWRSSDATVALPQKLFVFPATGSAPILSASDRRGAAQDQFGNYYWIGPDSNEILYFGSGQCAGQHFWSASDPNDAASSTATLGIFAPVSPAPAASYTMGGLAVTTDQYLVVGLVDPAGLLLFDLYSGAPPLEYRWPSTVPFAPFDLAAAADGGVWILDRAHRRYWGLDPYFRLLAPANAQPASTRAVGFQPTSGDAIPVPVCDVAEAVAANQAVPVAAVDPIGILGLPDGSVLILDSQAAPGYSKVYHYQGAAMAGAPVALNDIDIGASAPYKLLGQDFAFIPATQQSATGDVQGTLYVADVLGVQTFSFAYSSASTDWAQEPIPQFLPMLRFGGKGLTNGLSGVSYDLDQRWTPLVAQPRARFEESGVWQLPQLASDLEPNPALRAFDGKEPGCVWHRLMIDGTIPAGTELLVASRAADSKQLVSTAPWNPEPQPYLRGTGSELPYYQPALNCPTDRTGTWELLFQAARGRYLQLQLTFVGNGRSTPRIQALRAYYPRFSYLTKYLPAVYKDNAASASFLDRYLANTEGTFTALEGRIQQVQELFDGRTAPSDYLPWLASWIGVSFDLTWTVAQQRFFLENAPRFFQTRGTPDGMVRMIRMALDGCADDSLFDPADAEHFSVRILENFLLQGASGVALGDPSDVQSPNVVTGQSTWTPAQGAAPIDQQFRTFLSGEYATVAALNAAWNTSYAGFNDPTLVFPAVQPSQSAAAADWDQFVSSDLGFTYAQVTAANLPVYQTFLTQQYSQVGALNTAYGLAGAAALTSFADVESKLWTALTIALPRGGVFLQDWILFVSVVLPAQQSAHQFTVVVPVQLQDSVATQTQRAGIAQRIAQQEKPAHTSFNVQLYWAAFCAGQARVGIETVVGPSSRFAALSLDQGTLDASSLDCAAPWNVRDRIVVGRNQVQNGKQCGESAR